MRYCALVDCNNFFVSCERIFNPAIEKRPVIILSSNDGCVVARSYEAKQLGIAMGEPFFKVSDLCSRRDVVVYSSNYQLYGDLSRRVMATLATIAPNLEVSSIDEAFVWFPKALSTCEVQRRCIQARQRILQWVGIPTSIGIAPTKTLAKLATALAKERSRTACPDQNAVVLFSSSHEWEPILKTTPIRRLWGVGPGLEQQFHTLGIRTAWDLHESAPFFIRYRIGVAGERLLWELHGIPCLQSEEPKKRKSITCSRSFAEAITDPEELLKALAVHISSACEQLRKEGSYARAMYMFASTAVNPATEERDRYGTTIPFLAPTNETSHILNLAAKTVRQWAPRGLRYKKCGVVMLNLISEQQAAPDLFCKGPSKKQQEISHLVDAINTRFGKNTLIRGLCKTCDGSAQWRVRCDHRSRRYTTCWDELAIAHA